MIRVSLASRRLGLASCASINAARPPGKHAERSTAPYRGAFGHISRQPGCPLAAEACSCTARGPVSKTIRPWLPAITCSGGNSGAAQPGLQVQGPGRGVSQDRWSCCRPGRLTASAGCCQRRAEPGSGACFGTNGNARCFDVPMADDSVPRSTMSDDCGKDREQPCRRLANQAGCGFDSVVLTKVLDLVVAIVQRSQNPQPVSCLY